MPVTLHFQSTGTVPGNARPFAMLGRSITIGRSDDNDLMLPDPDGMISRRHCTIEDHDGNIVVIDLSSNGTFLNYGKSKLGRVPTPLNDGDILSIGSYELLVEIPATGALAQAARILPSLEDDPVSPGKADQNDDLMSLLDDPSSSGGDFLDDLLGGDQAPGGPSRVKRPELGDDGLLPPLDDDDGFLSRPAQDDGVPGASVSSHSASVEDHFRPPTGQVGTIPDDWDSLLEGIGDHEGGGPAFETAPPAGSGDTTRSDPTERPPVAQTIPATDFETDTSFGAQTSVPQTSVPQSTVPQSAGPEASVPTGATVQPGQGPDIGQGVGDVSLMPGPAAGPGADDAAARAFLKALGAADVPIADADLVHVMARMGHVLRILIHGAREVLMTRSSIKSEFRIEQTQISAAGNNPLKFSISPEQAVEALVRVQARGYLDAVDAAEQAMRDIKAHEVAMMTGMEAALKDLLARLAPETLEGKLETSGGIAGILKGRKARYWEVYEKLYAEIADQAENDFHALFAREFAKAYQAQLERLK